MSLPARKQSSSTLCHLSSKARFLASPRIIRGVVQWHSNKLGDEMRIMSTLMGHVVVSSRFAGRIARDHGLVVVELDLDSPTALQHLCIFCKRFTPETSHSTQVMGRWRADQARGTFRLVTGYFHTTAINGRPAMSRCRAQRRSKLRFAQPQLSLHMVFRRRNSPHHMLRELHHRAPTTSIKCPLTRCPRVARARHVQQSIRSILYLAMFLALCSHPSRFPFALCPQLLALTWIWAIYCTAHPAFVSVALSTLRSHYPLHLTTA